MTDTWTPPHWRIDLTDGRVIRCRRITANEPTRERTINLQGIIAGHEEPRLRIDPSDIRRIKAGRKDFDDDDQ